MEVEVKLKLLTESDYDKVNSLFGDMHVATYDQENYFFDGANKELSSQRVIARIRFYNTDEKALLAVKGKAVVENGVSRVSEEEHEIEPATGRQILQDPNKLLKVQTELVQKLSKNFNLTSIVSLGGFRNQRKVYNWEGLTLEVDKTLYDWGTVYEIECETANPDEVRDKLSEYLTSHEIGFKQGTTTKFANFVKRTLE